MTRTPSKPRAPKPVMAWLVVTKRGAPVKWASRYILAPTRNGLLGLFAGEHIRVLITPVSKK